MSETATETTSRPRAMQKNRQLRFSPPEMRRIEAVRLALGTTYVEFIHEAVMQTVEEMETTATELERRRRRNAYAGPL